MNICDSHRNIVRVESIAMCFPDQVVSARKFVAVNGVRWIALLSLLSVLYGTQVVAVDLMREQLKEEDLLDKSCEELRIMRNEIYARHGRKFGNPKLRQHFLEQNWYDPKIEPNDFRERLITNVQNKNIEYIKHFEAEKKCKNPKSVFDLREWGILEWSAAIGTVLAIIGTILTLVKVTRRCSSKKK